MNLNVTWQAVPFSLLMDSEMTLCCGTFYLDKYAHLKLLSLLTSKIWCEQFWFAFKNTFLDL